jgi:hypothetical protein
MFLEARSHGYAAIVALQHHSKGHLTSVFISLMHPQQRVLRVLYKQHPKFKPLYRTFGIRTMSSSNQPPSTSTTVDPHQSPAQQTEQSHSSNMPLPLPEPPKHSSTTTIDMSSGGETVKLDHLGPLVVNKDGTLSRISNWTEMTHIEQKNTLRVLGKRNQSRREALEREEGK